MFSKSAGKKRVASHEPDIEVEDDLNDALQVSDVEDEVSEKKIVSSSSSKIKSTSKPKSKKRKPTPSAGIVYISRLPPGMTPQKVKHLMGRWGEVGKIYAQKKDGEFRSSPRR